LRSDRRANPLGAGENDLFHQQMLSLAWTRTLSERTTVATTVYGFDAGGHYDIRDAAGFANYNLHSRWGGIVGTLGWRGDHSMVMVGINASDYARDHWLNPRGAVSWSVPYANTGHKTEGSLFAKGSLGVGIATLFGDVQLREARFRYEPRGGSIATSPSARWRFANPKVGISVRAAESVTTYLSAGMNGREPTRGDLLAGADNIDPGAESSLLPFTRVRAETVRDLELGASWRGSTARLEANAFVMSFRDELAPIGEINAIGYTLRKNVPRSFRRGVEAEGAWQITPVLAIDGNVAVTGARIAEYRDEATGVTYRDVVPLLTSKLTANHGVRVTATHWLSLDLDGRYVSRMMLTNTGDASSVLPPGYVADAAVTLGLGRQTVTIQVRNVLDRDLPTSGYADGVQSYYYPLAPRNLMVTARVRF
ncbi:MAG TPA: TonB-dependent receptor, partial [Gemmatimonadaceae bacterium]|nr:TonB-dependent receptor [Gemmatimonadaceae bacterium]